MTDKTSVPVVCDMTQAPDTDSERLEEYRQIFTTALVGREKTAEGFRWRFRDDEGIDAWVRDLAEREQACCAFFSFTVTRTGGEVRLDGSVVDDDTARAVIEEFYNLPATLAGDDVKIEDVDARFTRLGFEVLRPGR